MRQALINIISMLSAVGVYAITYVVGSLFIKEKKDDDGS